MPNQCYFYNLPEEIIIYIYTLSGYNEHREKFLKLLPEIKLKAVNRQLNVVENKYQNKHRQIFLLWKHSQKCSKIILMTKNIWF